MAFIKTKSTSRRSRQERFLRYILRRKQCSILFLFEFLTLISLILILLLFFWLSRNEIKQIERTKIENNWKKSEQHKLNFYKCNYEPIWEKAEQMNYDLCSYHYGKGAQIWSVQKTMTNSTRCVHKIHMLPCHKLLLQGAPSKIYNNERISPASCGGLFGAPMPYEYITSETAIRAPQVSNEMLERYYMNQTVLSTALHVKCPRCIVKSSWYASPISLHCRRQLVTLQYGWPYIAKYCDLEEQKEINLEKMIYC
uniref:Uncharacterized protein n=2 Tax=Wuchereria bancrofti TaxID=6293 RepID=A0AAF5RUA2_WUCBA